MAQPSGTVRPTNSPFHNIEWLVTEPYGTYDNGGTHNGMDLTQYPYNSSDLTIPVYSICNNGYVFQTGYNESMGNFVRFKDNESNYAFTYMHLVNNSIVVKAGDTINYGSKIGIMGSTGNSTAPHLHIEARVMNTEPTPNNYVNSPRTSPSDYLGIVNLSYRQLWRVYYWEYGDTPTPPIKPIKFIKSKFNWAIFGKRN